MAETMSAGSERFFANGSASQDNSAIDKQSSLHLFEKQVLWHGFEDNKDLQLQEINILESMYPNELEVISSAEADPESRNAFQLAVHVELPHKPVLVELWASAELEDNCAIVNTAVGNRPEEERPIFNRSVSGNRLHTSLLVEHVTPLLLTVVFPEAYPSEEPPVFSISCQWLSMTQLSIVANQLQRVFEENEGSPVIYLWTDWIKNELFETLVLQNLIISEDEIFQCDERVSSSNLDCFSRFAEVINYDFACTEKEFLLEEQTCQVCFGEDIGSKFVKLKPCLHHFCMVCITEYCVMHVQEGTVGQLRCPDDECKNTIAPDVLRQVLGDDEYVRWEQLMVQRTLEMMGDVVWCPRCSNPVVRDENDESLGLCAVCMFSFCTECNDMWHPGELCLELRTEENRKEMKDRRKRNNAAGPTQQDMREARAEMYRRYQERMISVEHETKNIKTCPHCKIKVEKIGGCSKMTCKCGKYFCWTCGAKISGYDHFTSGSCILFRNLAPRPVNDHVVFHDGYVAYRAALMQTNVQQKACPRCRNKNVKSGRLNMIKCWFCKGHFCFQCGANLAKVSPPNSHYTTNPVCQQHSD